MMAYKMNRFWILLKPCHVFPDWMIVEGIVQLRVRVVQEDKEEVETCIRLQPTPRCQETCSAAFKLDLLIIPARPAFKLDSNYIIQPHIQTFTSGWKEKNLLNAQIRLLLLPKRHLERSLTSNHTHDPSSVHYPLTKSFTGITNERTLKGTYSYSRDTVCVSINFLLPTFIT